MKKKKGDEGKTISSVKKKKRNQRKRLVKEGKIGGRTRAIIFIVSRGDKCGYSFPRHRCPICSSTRRRGGRGKKKKDFFSRLEIGRRKLPLERVATSRHHVRNDESRSNWDEMGFASLMILRTFSLINLREVWRSREGGGWDFEGEPTAVFGLEWEENERDGRKKNGGAKRSTHRLANFYPTFSTLYIVSFVRILSRLDHSFYSNWSN